jgi:hypothetical protein
MANALYAAKEWAKNSLADIKARPRNALIDATRGALLGATTDVVGYIPDAVADFMRPFGYNVPRDQVVGGTEWLANKFAQPTNSLAENAARFTTGMLTPSPMDFARLGKGPMQELTVYHGSPHRINNVDAEHPNGRFDTSKIGTGEGAQAYGHGIYLAENPEVARGYQKTLSSTAPPGDDAGAAYNFLQKMGGDEDYAKEVLGQQIEAMLANGSPNLKTAEGMLAALNSGAYKAHIPNPGHFYTVDLPDEHIANMLDWDAPLSEQPEALRRLVSQHAGDLTAQAAQSKFDEMELIATNDSALYQRWKSGELSKPAARVANGTATANDIARINRAFKEFAGVFDADDFVTGLEREKGVSVGAALEKAGIANPETGAPLSKAIQGLGYPGIRYLDGGSRADGQGTRNFVIFDGNTAKILKRE